jgi:preprotein translocase subunit SecB
MVIEPAPLQLEGYYVRRLAFSIRPNADERAELAMGTGLHVQTEQVMTADPYSVDVKIESSKHKTDERRFRVLFEVSLGENDTPTCPYVFDLEVMGYFHWAGPPSTPENEIFIVRNAGMVLYSACREILASAMARGPFPAMILPTYAFTIEDHELAPLKKSLRKALGSKRSTTKTPARRTASKKR